MVNSINTIDASKQTFAIIIIIMDRDVAGLGWLIYT